MNDPLALPLLGIALGLGFVVVPGLFRLWDWLQAKRS